MYLSRTVWYRTSGSVCDFLGSVHAVTQTITVRIVYVTTHMRRTEILECEFYLKSFGSASGAVYQL